MGKGWRIALALFALVAIAAFFGRLTTSSDWRYVGGLDNDDIFHFVIVTPGLETKRAVYDTAVAAICEHPTAPRICSLLFFAQGDRIPPRQPKGPFFDAGGFRNYPSLAAYWRNQNTGMAEYTAWDCKRAGLEGAPLNSLCDPAVKSASGAAIDLGIRNSSATACRWPQTDDRARFAAYLATVQDQAQREMYRKNFDSANTGNGPDDRADCIKLRAHIEQRAATHVRLLESHNHQFNGPSRGLSPSISCPCSRLTAGVRV